MSSLEPDGVPAGTAAARPRSPWRTRRALLSTLAVVVWFPGCLVAGWWQVTVALSGNQLAYLYSVEWPVFAVFGVVFWWHLVHDDPETVGSRALSHLRAARPAESGPTAPVTRRREEEDDRLAAYNDYLEGLAASDAPKTWRRK
jgi:DNA-binding transcriptional regulator of glucitol operon